MAYDTTPPRDKMILGMGLLSVATLIALMPMFRMYFYSVIEPLQQEQAATAGLAQRQAYEAEQRQKLTSLAGTLQQFGQAGRSSSPLVSPRLSTENANVDAVEGWSEAKDERAARSARFAFQAAREREAARAAAQADAGVPVEGAPAPQPTVTP